MGVGLFIFDLDGVITHTSQFHAQAWSKLTERLGYTFNDELAEATKGISRKASLECILAYHKINDQFSEAEKIQLMEEKNSIYVSLLQGINEDDYLPGIKPLLLDIKAHGFPVAIASASENAPFILKRLKAEPFIDYIVNPRTVRGKPAPDIFLKAAEHFNIPPHNCIAIEDAQSGIDGIKAAGMFAVGVGENLKGVDLRVTSTSELIYKNLIEAFENR